MDKETYVVIFKGKIIEGTDIDTVKTKIGRLFKQDRAKVETLFSGKPVVVKKSGSLADCQKIRKAFQQAGAVCSIARAKPKAPRPPAARPQATPSRTQAPAAPAAAPRPKPQAAVAPKTPIPDAKAADQTTCKSCGGTIQRGAKTCFHCGLPARGGPNRKVLIYAGILGGLVILGILAAVAVPWYSAYRNRTHLAAIQAELQKVKEAESRYYEKYRTYTDSMAALNMFITSPDIKVQILQADENCFQAKGVHTRAEVETRIDCNSPDLTAAAAVSDLASGSEPLPGYDDAGTAPSEPLFTSSEGGFEVMFPEEPTYNVESVYTPAGKIDIHFYMVEKTEFACIVGYSDYPEALMEQADHDTLLTGAANGAVSNISASITDQQDIDLDGYYGREITFTIPNSFKMPKGGNGKARFYIVDNRLYQILKIGTDTLSDNETDRYLDSFNLLY